jgi:hypothetical protein
MIKMFRVPVESEMLFQTSLVDREINEMMNMRRVKKVLQQTGNNDAQAEPMEKVEPGHVARRPLESGDIWYDVLIFLNYNHL